MLTIEYVKNPVYANPDETVIDLIVKFEEFSEELPYTATSHDTASHGIELFQKAMNGEYGVIGKYVPPPIDEQGNATQPQPIVEGVQTL